MKMSPGSTKPNADSEISQKLNESERRIRAILEHTVDGIITINDKGIIESFNPACEKIFGYKAEEVIGKNVKILMPEPYHGEHDGYLRNYHKTGDAKIIGIGREIQGRKKDGTVFHADLSISEVILEGKRLYSGIVRDITERKESERMLEIMNEKLKRSNQDMETFTYIASHDLRGPLVNLRGFTCELEQTVDETRKILEEITPLLDETRRSQVRKAFEDDIPKAIDFISNAITRLDTLTNAILELSRIGRRKLTFEKIDTNELVTHCVNTLKHQIDKNNMKVKISKLPAVTGDYVSIQQVFGNLLDNAIKYRSPKRNGVISISGAREGPLVKFQVADNGKGIIKENIPKVFEIFRRLDDSGIPGEGMGMAYVKSIVQRHGGEVWCDSEFDKGTSFYFTINDTMKRGTTGDAKKTGS